MKIKRNAAVQPDLDQLYPMLISQWRRLHKIPGPPDVLQTREFRGVVSAVKALQEGLETKDTLRGQDYFKDKNLLGAYLLYQWVLHYAQGISLIGELGFIPDRVLELCSGPAPFAFAALRHGASDAWALDRNTSALELGASLCGYSGYPLSIRTGDVKKSLPVEGQFDLIVLGYSLLELFPDTVKGWQEAQNQFIMSLLQRLTAHGALLLVENSWNVANQRVLKLRDYCAHSGINILAPCLCQESCPMLAAPNGSCYAQREFEKPYLIKEIQRAAQINLSSLKMSYLMLNHPQAQRKEREENLYRVISPAIETFKGKRFFLCGSTGKKMLGSRIDNHPSTSRAFEYLKRGDVISIEKALENKDVLEVIEDTVVTVVSPAGKPI